MANLPPLSPNEPKTTWTDSDHRPAIHAGFGNTVLPDVDPHEPYLTLKPRTETRFIQIQPLGQGGVGEVLSAFDQDIGRKVAIKRIRSDRQTEATIMRFLQEIRTVGRLEHANIIPIHDVGRDAEGSLYFVMRHIDGETLESILRKLKAGNPDYHRRYGFERRVQIILAVLDALAFAHAQGIIHRDVKPANVMVSRYSEVMLLDWGIARITGIPELSPPDAPNTADISHIETRIGTRIGTPAYMSPEQARGEPVDARSDVYSVSVMLHEFLCLSHYLEDCTDTETLLKAIQTRPVGKAPRMTSPYQGVVPMDLIWFIEPGVQKDPNRRYPNIEAMRERLARRAEGDIPVQCPVTFSKRVLGKTLRLIEQHAMFALVILGFAGFGVVMAVGVGIVTIGSLGAYFILQ